MDTQKKQNKMVSLINSFDKDDYSRFSNFLKSPFFNTNENLIVLFRQIQKCLKTYNPSEVTYEHLFSKIYPQTNYNGVKIRKHAVLMVTLIEKYFEIKVMENNKQLKHLLLLQELNKRNLCDLFEELIAEYEQTRTNTMLAAPVFLMNDLIIQYEQYRYSQSKLDYEKVNTLSKHFYDSAEILNINLRLIALNMNLLNKKLYVGTENNVNVKEFFRKYNTKITTLSSKFPGTFLLFLLAELLFSKNLIKSKEIVDYTRQNLSNLHYGTIDFVYNTLFSFLLQEKDIYGESDYSTLSYSDLKEFGILDRQKMISPLNYLYITILHSQLLAGKPENYYSKVVKNKLNPNQKESLYCIALAILNMSKGNYQEALGHLSLASSKNYYIFITIKMLGLQINYELMNIKYLDKEIDALKHFLNRRNEIPDLIKTEVRMFLVHFRHLTLISKANESVIKEFKGKVINEAHCSYKEWLLQKADELLLSQKTHLTQISQFIAS